ncbi:MAG TPA: bifunctional riboflavin kinase/FAD synthetase [Jiangellaceae bacterium]
MAVWWTPDEVPGDLGRTVVTIGVFDGVHKGHQAVIGRAAKHAMDAGVPVVAITFDPNPMVVVRPDAAPASLVPLERRIALLGDAGADHILVLPFDKERAQQPADEFVTDVLISVCGVLVIVVGEDFRFGHRAAGDVALLRRLGAEHGFSVDAVEIVGGEGAPRWSSTHIRDLVAGGDVAAAADALGRPYRFEGVVARGEGRGRELGYPTANLPVRDGELAPADGVYAGWVTVPDDPSAPARPAAISVGTNPTFGGSTRTVEPYVLDRDDLDLYGLPIAVDFVDRIRGQERFASVDDLVAQMAQDVAQTRRVLEL